jgi:replicative DNA helicase
MSNSATPPILLSGNQVAVPGFPVNALPSVIADMVAELAVDTQTDPAMAGTSALTVLAACIGGHAKVEVRHGWREPLCLYTVTVARPAERKSAVQAAMFAPLYAAESDLSMAGEMNRLTKADELDMAKATVERLNRDAVNAASKAAKTGTADDKNAADAAAKAAKDAKANMRQIDVPVIPRLLADDASPAALKDLLANHNGRIAIISTEGGIFDVVASRYHTENVDVFTKAHSGDRITVDRKGQATVIIPSPALTIGLMIQPRIIEAISANRDFVGRGVLARFLYATPVSMVGSRVSDATPVSEATENRYSDHIQNLASEMAKWVSDPIPLMLDPLAEAEVRRIQDDVESMLVGDGEMAAPDTLVEWGGKYVGGIIRIAGLLHLGQGQHGASGLRNSPVQPETIRAAERIGEYYKAAAINTLTVMGTDPGDADAIYLLEVVRKLGKTQVTERDLFNAARGRFPAVADMTPALKRLIGKDEKGWLVPLEMPKQTKAGRPASPRYRVHPDALGDQS